MQRLTKATILMTATVLVLGAGAAIFKLTARDVEHPTRPAAKRSMAGGSMLVPSDSRTASSRRRAGCFTNPEACGYPGRNNTGPEQNAPLTEEHREGTIMLTGNEVLERKRLVGRNLEILVEGNATGVHIVNDEIVTTGSCHFRYTEGCASVSVQIEAGASGTVLAHNRLGGSEESGANAVQECVRSYTTGKLRAEYNSFEHCGGIKPDGGGDWVNNYCPMNYELYEEHDECVSDDQLKGVPYAAHHLVLKHNTLLNPHYETAAIFLQGYSEKVGEVRIEDNLIAGGGRLIYGGEEGRSEVKGPEIITGNRFARACKGRDDVVGADGSLAEGHMLCRGQYAGQTGEVRAKVEGGSSILTSIVSIKGALLPDSEVAGDGLPPCRHPGLGRCTKVKRLTGEYAKGAVEAQLSRSVDGSGAREASLKVYSGSTWELAGDGYFPNGGSYSVTDTMPSVRAFKWSGNYWDDNLREVAKP